MGSSTIGDPNFPITFALVGWSGFSLDSFDSTYPDSLLISQAILKWNLERSDSQAIRLEIHHSCTSIVLFHFPSNQTTNSCSGCYGPYRVGSSSDNQKQCIYPTTGHPHFDCRSHYPGLPDRNLCILVPELVPALAPVLAPAWWIRALPTLATSRFLTR